MASGKTVSAQNTEHTAQRLINGPVVTIMIITIIRSSNSKEVKIYRCCGFVMKQICSVISEYSQCIPWARQRVAQRIQGGRSRAVFRTLTACPMWWELGHLKKWMFRRKLIPAVVRTQGSRYLLGIGQVLYFLHEEIYTETSFSETVYFSWGGFGLK